MKRIILFIATNLAVMLVIGVIVRVFGFDRFLTANGLNLPALLGFSAVVGFAGAIISLLISKWMAKRSTGARIIDTPQNPTEVWLMETVTRLAQKANIGMPEVGVYEGAPNAFATGAFKNSAMVAVSSGLLESMTKEEVEAVLAHEVAHVANGDMVTLTLIQGVVNTFVIFFARIVGYAVDSMLRSRSDSSSSGPGPAYMITSFICEILFGVLASIIVAWFSRQREFRADAGSANYMGNNRPMINALARLGGLEAGDLPKSLAASGIGMPAGMSALFASHPPIEQRIAALQARG
jgi:heat shock protein HtpX